jgi:hypothetical protein
VDGQYDVVVAPALAEAPVLLDDVHWQTDDPMGLFTRLGRLHPVHRVANVTGQPAIALSRWPSTDGSCRWACSSSGGRARGRPAAVATQLETARPWAQRRPASEDECGVGPSVPGPAHPGVIQLSR